MRKIQKWVEQINDELESAKEYAECYLMHKSEGETTWANRFKVMADDELKHATVIHDLAVEKIKKLREFYTPPVYMEEKWNQSHKEYVEKAAWVRQMLSM